MELVNDNVQELRNLATKNQLKFPHEFFRSKDIHKYDRYEVVATSLIIIRCKKTKNSKLKRITTITPTKMKDGVIEKKRSYHKESQSKITKK